MTEVLRSQLTHWMNDVWLDPLLCIEIHSWTIKHFICNLHFIFTLFIFPFTIIWFCFAGAIFEQGTEEVQAAFKFALHNYNGNSTARRFELQAYVDVINTADAFKLSRLSK